jgi:hypothetical protein
MEKENFIWDIYQDIIHQAERRAEARKRMEAKREQSKLERERLTPLVEKREAAKHAAVEVPITTQDRK